MNPLEGERLRLELAELQLEMYKLKAQYQTYAYSLLSIMVVADVFLLIQGVSLNEPLWFITALCVTIAFILLVNIFLEYWFLNIMNDLKMQIRELRKKHLL